MEISFLLYITTNKIVDKFVKKKKIVDKFVKKLLINSSKKKIVDKYYLTID